jgi:predicted secreted acid phosphatase
VEKSTNISTEGMWKTKLPTEYELKMLVLTNDPILNILERYVRNFYWRDIYKCFRMSMAVVNIYMKHFPLNNLAVVIDLDETFLQNASFAPTITKLWRKPRFYDLLAKQDMGAVLPYMIIFYEYILSKGIKPIFLTGRNQRLRELTIKNLELFGVRDYVLYMNSIKDSRKFKNMIYNTIKLQYNIICVLNDQDEINTINHIKFPQLYRIP